MTRCGDPDCHLPSHQPRGIPVTYAHPMTRREWDRRDPDYDALEPKAPPPLMVLVPVAFGVFLAFLIMLALVIVMLGPER